MIKTFSYLTHIFFSDLRASPRVLSYTEAADIFVRNHNQSEEYNWIETNSQLASPNLSATFLYQIISYGNDQAVNISIFSAKQPNDICM